MGHIQALLLSIVEGVTEFLPISSTGHMILASKLLSVPQTEFVKSFEIIIQLGAILAVVLIYFQKVMKKTRLWPRILVAFVPTGIVGLVLYEFIKRYLLGNLNVVIISLFLGGVVMLIFEEIFKRIKDRKISSAENLNLPKSAVVGVIQSLSVIPGVSRAMVTIFGGLGVGMSREGAVEFSFLLAVPTMLAATGLDLIKTHFLFTGQEYFILAIGFLGAFISAIITVKFFIKFVQKNNFIGFAIYRIVLTIIFWLVYR